MDQPTPGAELPVNPPSPATVPDLPPAPLPVAVASGGEGHRGVALLLGAVAVLAAVVGARSTALANDATDLWQSALRTDVKRSAAALEDIRYVYQAEVPVALVVMGGRLKAEELRTAAAATSGEAAARLTMEADVESGVVSAIEGASSLVTDPVYALPGGGVNLGQRLADQRTGSQDLVDLDPAALAEEGDHLAGKGSSMTLALLPLGFAALFGAMAQPFWGARRLLLAAGTGALGIGAAIALMVEVLG